VTPVRLLLGVAAAGGWLVAARLLLDTAVPDDLELAEVDAPQVFGEQLVAEAERYERVLLVLWVLSQMTLVAALWVYARKGAAFARESAAGPIGTGMLLGMLGLAIVWLVRLPFGIAGLWWGRRHEVSEMGYLEWLLGDWLALGGAFVSICLALVVVMALARRLGELWWIPGAGVFVAIATLFAFGAPYLVSAELDRPTDTAVAARYEQLAQTEGVADVPLREEHVSGDTSQANAYAFGIGPSRRIVLWDTLVDGRFSDGEVDVVLAHELAHHSAGHIPEAIAWFGLFALPGTLVLMLVTRRRGGMGRAESVPLALLTVAAFMLVVAPAQNWISRESEREADWKALQSTRDDAAARGLFVGFSETSLGDPDPPTWAYLLLSTHPTLEQRVAMADAWRTRNP